MILYEYLCDNCKEYFTDVCSIEDRDQLTKEICQSCGAMSVRRLLTTGGFTVPEGGCGNAKNGYSSYHGDSQNFKSGRKVYK